MADPDIVLGFTVSVHHNPHRSMIMGPASTHHPMGADGRQPDGNADGWQAAFTFMTLDGGMMAQ